MCRFFSSVLDGDGKLYYFDKDQRQTLAQTDGALYNKRNQKYYIRLQADSHDSIMDFYGLNESECAKYEFDFMNNKMQIDENFSLGSMFLYKSLNEIRELFTVHFPELKLGQKPEYDRPKNVDPSILTDAGEGYLLSAIHSLINKIYFSNSDYYIGKPKSFFRYIADMLNLDLVEAMMWAYSNKMCNFDIPSYTLKKIYRAGYMIKPCSKERILILPVIDGYPAYQIDAYSRIEPLKEYKKEDYLNV